HLLPTSLLHSFVHSILFHSFPTRPSSDLHIQQHTIGVQLADRSPRLLIAGTSHYEVRLDEHHRFADALPVAVDRPAHHAGFFIRSEEHTSELQSRENLVCRLLLENKKINN